MVAPELAEQYCMYAEPHLCITPQDFDDLLSKHVELSFFLPLIIGYAGNSGSQTTCAIIRCVQVLSSDTTHGFLPSKLQCCAA